MTARNRICPLRTRARNTAVRSRPLASLCNPIECPLARGHFDSANDALYEAIATHDVLDADCVEQVAARHHVCPYELQRDMARWADVIICDYHYAFSPSASLLGLANEPDGGQTVLLVDEAHNLVERMRDMYSAELAVAQLEGLERLLRTDGAFCELTQTVRDVIRVFPPWKQALPPTARPGARGRAARPSHRVVHTSDAFADCLTRLADGIDATLERLSPLSDSWKGNDHRAGAHAQGAVEVYLALRDMGLATRAFLGALQRAGTSYVTFLNRAGDTGRTLKVYCVDPSHDLGERLESALAAVFFSGTLTLMDYFRQLLAAQTDDDSVFARSSFDSRHRQVLIGSDITARYSRRGPELYAHCASYLATLLRVRPGNYLAFLPSYAVLEKVAEVLGPHVGSTTKIVRQRPGMSERERESFVAEFREPRSPGTSLVGLCVLGGVFGESIDLPGTALVGVVVLGTGMPRASAEREVIREHFDARGGKGFAYAYTYPGMIKVLQAAGRFIRTEEDRGVVLLLDDRFLEGELQRAFPVEWKNVHTCTLSTLPALLART
jgi:Rad3-related DNA helicase